LFLLCAGNVGGEAQVPLGEYAQRRARLLEQVKAPVVLFAYDEEAFGISGAERMSPESTFRQEENFYYLSGHREPGAALLLIPATAGSSPSEILFLRKRDPNKERWEGIRLGPDDPEAAANTGFATVLPLADLQKELKRLADAFADLYTLLPPRHSNPEHAQAGRWVKWLKEAVPAATLKDVRNEVGAMRQMKSKAEQALLRTSIDRSAEAMRAAIGGLRPGIHEYELAALIEYTYKRAGCERSGFPPITASGPNGVILHATDQYREMKAGEVVIVDIGAECAGYTADLSRTLPVSGKFSERQRKIYEVVLGAQEAVLKAIKPGMKLRGDDEKSLRHVAVKYLNERGEELVGEPLGQYFLHGIGHHIGLQVHDAGPHNRPLEPGMVVMVEPGIYMPEEHLGIRIEDPVLVTEDGAVLLTPDLPRKLEGIEHMMSASRAAE
jgi:Xaa-Pro aminopeptidase